MLVVPRRFARQPTTPARVDPKYLPIGGIQPAASGLYDSTGQPLTVAAGTTQSGSRITFGSASPTGLSRANANVSGFPATFVFQGTVSDGGVRCLSSIANSSDLFVRVYAYAGQLYAQAAGAAGSSQAIAAAGLVNGQTFTAVIVFDSPTSRRIYTRTGGKTATGADTGNVGATGVLNIVAFGQYLGNSPNYPQYGDTELAQWLGVAPTAGEAQALLVNPWGLFTSTRRTFARGAASTGATVTPDTGHATLTGYAPTVARTAAQTTTPATGHATLTGYAPTVRQSQGAAPSTGHVALTGYAPTVARTAAQTVSPATGHATFTGYAPAVTKTAAQTVTPTTGHLAFAGYAPTSAATAGQTNGAAPSTGHATFTGYTPTVARTTAQTITPATGHVTLTGYAPGIGQPRTITPTTGHLAFAGYAPAATRTAAQTVAPATGHVALTGYAPAVTRSTAQTITPATGHVTLTGHPPGAPSAAGIDLLTGGGPDNGHDDANDQEEHFALAAKAGKKMYGKALPAPGANTPLPAAGDSEQGAKSALPAGGISAAAAADASLASVLRPNPAVAAQLADEHRSEPAISAASAPSDEGEEECLLLLLLEVLTF